MRPADDEPEERADEQPEPEWARRKRLAAAFGDDEPAGRGDAWYLDQVPPHHG